MIFYDCDNRISIYVHFEIILLKWKATILFPIFPLSQVRNRHMTSFLAVFSIVTGVQLTYKLVQMNFTISLPLILYHCMFLIVLMFRSKFSAAPSIRLP